MGVGLVRSNRRVNLDVYVKNARARATTEARRERSSELGEREKQVAMLIAQEKGNDEIALEMGTSRTTVVRQVYNVMQKLGAKSRVGVAVWACKHLLPLLLIAAALHAQTFVNSSSGGAGGANGGTTGSIDMTLHGGANFFYIGIGYFGGSAPTFTVSDSQSNGYTALTNYNNGTTGLKSYYAQAASNSSTMTFTVSASSSFSGFTVLGFNGMATSSVFQAGTDVGATFASAQASLATGSINYAANSVVITTALSTNASDSITPSGAIVFTTQDHIAFNSGVNEGDFVAYSIQASSGSVNPSWSTFNGNTGAASVAAFSKAAAGGATPAASKHKKLIKLDPDSL